MGYLDTRAFAGMVARGGESLITAISYINDDAVNIPFGVFVANKSGGAVKISSATDQILGVSLKLGTKSENKPGEVMSVLSIPHGAEVWVQGKIEHGLVIGDMVQIEATPGDDAGKVTKTATLSLTTGENKFYVTEISGELVKLMRKE